MSSILRALKRIETESQDPVGKPKRSPEGQGGRERSWSPGWFDGVGKAFFFGLMILVLLTAAWFVINPWPFFTKRSPIAPRVADKILRDMEVAAPDSPVSPKKRPQSDPVRQPNQGMTTSAASKGKSTKTHPLGDKGPSKERMVTSGSPIRSNQADPVKPSTPMALSTKAPDDLQIHAIAWAPLAENRIAVINGHVVREGAFVEGVEIVGIEMDEVIVRRGERQWRLRSK